jgi:acyl dehydratase
MKVGDCALVTRAFTGEEVAAWHALSQAQTTIDAVPEPMIGALFSYLLGVVVPGPGTNYLKQDLQFHAPAAIGAALTASVAITRLRPDKSLVDLDTRCFDGSGALIASGRALVYVGDIKGAFD